MLFFWIERKEDNIYDFFTIQEDSKVLIGLTYKNINDNGGTV